MRLDTEEVMDTEHIFYESISKIEILK